MNHQDLLKTYVENPQMNDKKGSRISVQNKVIYSHGIHFPLMIALDDKFIINADRYSVSTSKHQSYANSEAGYNGIAIPFSALEAAGINAYNTGNLHKLFENLKIIEHTNAKWIKKTRKDPKTKELIEYEEHILGACVFSFKPSEKGRRKRYFISGTDDTGSNPRGSYFLTELKKPVTSVMDALNQLAPEAVKQAELNNIEIHRQGEWFFVKVSNNMVKGRMDARGLKPLKDFTLIGINSNSGSHVAKEGITLDKNSVYVRSTIKHTGKEHKMLSFKKEWFQAHHNVQKASFNATGGFD